MDLRVEWSPEAVEDVDSIAEYISRDSKYYAGSVVTKLLAISRDLSIFPRAGRVVPELDDENYRE
ncbi:MAG: type II toxin-antitoxin system RelE/ParE family toxin [Spirochaetota bacterium]